MAGFSPSFFNDFNLTTSQQVVASIKLPAFYACTGKVYGLQEDLGACFVKYSIL